jgi:hypothetical protein
MSSDAVVLDTQGKLTAKGTALAAALKPYNTYDDVPESIWRDHGIVERNGFTDKLAYAEYYFGRCKALA